MVLFWSFEERLDLDCIMIMRLTIRKNNKSGINNVIGRTK